MSEVRPRPDVHPPPRADGAAAIPAVSQRERRLEILASVLMSIAVVATAYCAWQSSRWSGHQTLRYAEAATLRLESAKADDAAHTLASYDAQTFVQVATAEFAGDRRQAKRLADLFIRDAFKSYVDKWLALDPTRNPTAPQSPFDLPGYRSDDALKAQRLEKLAARRFRDAQVADQNADDYILATVFFATVLFFAGISSKFEATQVRTGILVMASLGLVAGLALMIKLPFR